MGEAENKPKNAITVRVAEPLYELLRDHARSRDISLNSVVAEAIAQYSVRIRRAEAVRRIEALQQRMQAPSVSERQSDSTQDLRDLRQLRSQERDCQGATKETP
jgi:hypothetical protein